MEFLKPIDLAVVIIIALLLFGPKKLPELGRGIGSGIREFKQSISGAPTVVVEPEPAEKPHASVDRPVAIAESNVVGTAGETKR